MTDWTSRKVTPRHLQDKAFLYVRQSTLRQVAQNQESTRRQYALRERAAALGWSAEQLVVIDSDLGLSGASAEREGFQKLVTEVSMGRAGIVLGLEVSRLARNSSDWHRLLEICALTQTLILDEDGLYDPTDYNDRLLLGLKGTLSEAELHMLRQRMRGGLLAKARRGELRIGLPVGFIYDDSGEVLLHPDAQVRDTINLFFQTYLRTGSACATVKYFCENNIPFPAPAKLPHTAQVVWGRLSLGRAVHLLHNPRYAGAFCYGRRTSRKQPSGKSRSTAVPRDQWHVLLLDAHPGYLSWEQFERIQHQLRTSALAYGLERHHGPARQGPALLQGLVLCGRCGMHMSVRYHRRAGRLIPDYVCQTRTVQYRDAPCQVIPGGGVDAAVGRLLLDTMTPMTLELTLAVQAQIEARLEQVDRLRRQQLQRAQHEADRARLRYLQVDPTNRLVAATLEAAWNESLRAVSQITERVERERAADRATFDDTARQRVRSLAATFPQLWNAPSTPDRERKRMVALLVNDVTLSRVQEQITIGVRFRGGANTSLSVAIPLNAWRQRKTHPKALARAQALLEAHTNVEVATRLNEEGFTTGAGTPFNAEAVSWIERRWKLKTYHDHLLAVGHLTTDEMAALLGVNATTIRQWRRQGRLRAVRYNDKGAYLFEPLQRQPEDIRTLAAPNQAQNRQQSSTLLKANTANSRPGAV